VKAGALVVAIAGVAIALPATTAAQAPPACAPGTEANVTLRTEDDDGTTAIVATHEAEVTANIGAADPTNVSITPQGGGTITGDNGETVALIAPPGTSMALLISWRQSVDESNPEETARCSASRTITVPLLAARPAYGAKQPNPGPPTGDYTFAAVPTSKRPDLRPLEITVRSTGHARYPRARERLRTWTLPMRTGEQVKYHKRLPNLAYATTPQKCRFWWFTCGVTFANIAQLNVNSRGTGPDLSGSNSILRTLAFTQPARWAARYGIVITATPGARRPNAWGYDIQVRQAGRLLARVRRAGRCRLERRSYGIYDNCRLSRSSTLLR
jgi:hypothetical protein